MNDSTIDWAHIINQALTVEMKDSIHYNQVSGKEMKAYFVNGDMRHIEVIGNVLTAFYPEEKDSTMTGFNCLEGSMLHLYMKDKRMEKGLLSVNPTERCIRWTRYRLINCVFPLLPGSTMSVR